MMNSLLNLQGEELVNKLSEADAILNSIPLDNSVAEAQATAAMLEVTKEIPTRPVSISQLKSWLACKRKWALQRVYPDNSVKDFFVLGKAVHRGLEIYYQTKGDLDLALLGCQRELVPDVENNFLDMYPLVKSMVTGYINFDKKYHNYDILCTEMEFEVPLTSFTNAQILEMPEEARKLIPKAKGIIDAIAVVTKPIYVTPMQVIEPGEIIAVEYKTAARAGNIDYETDPQATLYLLALSKILGTPVRYIVYNTLYKKQPSKPEILKSGDVSARAITTTQEIYGNALLEVYGSIEAAPEKCQSLYKNLATSDVSFFDRTFVYRSQEELDELQDRLSVAIPTLNQDYDKLAENFEESGNYTFEHCYPNPGRDCSTMCEKRDQCLNMNRKQPILEAKTFLVKIGQKGE